MEETKTLVKMDAQGNIKIPEETMKKHNWKDGDHVAFEIIKKGSIRLTNLTQKEKRG